MSDRTRRALLVAMQVQIQIQIIVRKIKKESIAIGHQAAETFVVLDERSTCAIMALTSPC